MRPTRSRGATARSMLSSATKPPKRLERRCTSSRFDVIVRGHGHFFTDRRCRRLCHRPTMPFGAMITNATSSTPTIRRLTAEEIVTVVTCSQRAEQHRADQRPEPGGGAADHRHRDRVHGVFQRKRRRRLQVADVIGKRRAGHAHQRARQRRRDEFEAQRRHAGGLRRELVVADGGEAVAELGVLDGARDDDRDEREREHHQEQILDVGQVQQLLLRRPDHIGAARAADIIPVHDERLEHHRHRQRRDGEEGAAQPQREVAHAEPDQPRHRGADHDQHRDRQLIELVEEHGGIGAEREERRGAEIHVAGVAAENVPGGGEHDELQHRVAGEEDVVVADRARRRRRRGRRRRCRARMKSGVRIL